MAKKKAKKSSSKDKTLEKLALATAIINLIHALIDMINNLLE